MLRKVVFRVVRALSVPASFSLATYLNVIAFFLFITIIVAFNIWGELTAGIVVLVSLFVSIVFWKVICKNLSRVFRSFIFGFFAILFAAAIFGLVGALGLSETEVPLYSILGAVSLGLSAEMTAGFLTYDMFRRASFCERIGLGADDLLRQFSALPQHIQTSENIVNAYAAAAHLPWLFANSEYKTVVIIIGSILEELLRSVYKGEQQDSPSKKAKALGLNVAYGNKNRQKATFSFDIEYFWRNVRSKHAHSIHLQKIAPATFAVDEPSEEIVRESIGLLGVFLKSFSHFCKETDFPS